MLAQGLFPNYNNYNINIPTFKIPYLAYFRSTKFLGEPDYVVVGGVGLLQQVPEKLHRELKLKGKRTQKVKHFKWQNNLALQAV